MNRSVFGIVGTLVVSFAVCASAQQEGEPTAFKVARAVTAYIGAPIEWNTLIDRLTKKSRTDSQAPPYWGKSSWLVLV